MVNAQLSLFDTAAVIKPAYKVGDRVKLRKKPIAASYVKKGDIVEIVAVHPLDCSIKFWNERSERWEFVQRDEIGCVVPDDSPTPAEIAVIESTLAPAENDSITLNPISTYKAGGTARSGEYFRLSYRIGERVRHCHIRGGIALRARVRTKV